MVLVGKDERRIAQGGANGSDPADPAARQLRVTVLDDAFDRVAALDYEIPNPFVNHAPMVCEALSTMGLDHAVGAWVAGTDAAAHRPIQPVTPTWGPDFPWQDQVGDFRLLPQWLGYFERAIGEDGWRDVIATWVPRFMPELVSALFHGVIRTSHAVRALDAVETPSRRAELARGLGNWAVWFGGRQPVGAIGLPEPTDRVERDHPAARTALAAARAAGHFVADPNIVALHAVTGAMAVQLLSGYVAEADAAAALRQLEAEHAAIFRDAAKVPPMDVDDQWETGLERAAVKSSDPHQIKLVEACLRGLRLTDDTRFVAAARVVTDTPRAGPATGGRRSAQS